MAGAVQVAACTPLVMAATSYSGNMARLTLPCSMATPFTKRERRRAM